MKNMTDEDVKIAIEELENEPLNIQTVEDVINRVERLKYLRALCYGEANLTDIEYDEICSLLGEYQTMLLGIKLRF